jgi:hypothetical protein
MEDNNLLARRDLATEQSSGRSSAFKTGVHDLATLKLLRVGPKTGIEPSRLVVNSV